MDDGLYRIMSGLSYQGHKLFLGVKVAREQWGNGELILTSVVNDTTLWRLTGIPGTSGFYLSTEKTGLWNAPGEPQAHLPSICFDPFAVFPLDVIDREYVLYADDVGDGQVALNNHDKSRVIDIDHGERADGSRAIAFKWNGGENQRWRFYAA